MKYLLCSAVVVLVSAVCAVERLGVCPSSSGLAGICMFDPKVNCLEDTACPAGQKCCSEGCNKVCKKALDATPKAGKCPQPSGLVSICVFVPGYNCLSDSECDTGKKCCSEGCGRVCKPVV